MSLKRRQLRNQIPKRTQDLPGIRQEVTFSLSGNRFSNSNKITEYAKERHFDAPDNKHDEVTSYSNEHSSSNSTTITLDLSGLTYTSNSNSNSNLELSDSYYDYVNMFVGTPEEHSEEHKNLTEVTETSNDTSSLTISLGTGGLTFTRTQTTNSTSNGKTEEEYLVNGQRDTFDSTEVEWNVSGDLTSGVSGSGSITRTSQLVGRNDIVNIEPLSFSSPLTTTGSASGGTGGGTTTNDESADGGDGTSGVGAGGVPNGGSIIPQANGDEYVYDADGNLVGMLTDDGNVYWPADWDENGPVDGISTNALEEIAIMLPSAINFGTNTCERYAMNLEQCIRDLHHLESLAPKWCRLHCLPITRRR